MSQTEKLKTTALDAIHHSLGAKMVPFAGYSMPIQYSNLKEEHHAVRNSVGIFDVSHMGEFAVKGDGAEALIEWISSNNVGKLIDMQAQYNCMPNEDGGIVDDLIIYRWNNKEFTLVVNASNIEKDWNWINKWNDEKGFGAKLENQSEEVSLLAVQGPNAIKTIQKLTDVNLSEIDFYHFSGGAIGGVEDVVISNTGYTGSGGFELYVWNNDAPKLWEAIMEAGKEYDIMPCGLGCRDTLRLEKGYCLYGNDINDSTSLIEAGLGWITKFDAPFVNWEFHKKIKEDKPAKRLVGFKMVDRGIPRQHYPILDAEGTKIGEVTSGTQSPSLNEAIGMGYVTRASAKSGSSIFIEIRGKAVQAEVVKMPFL